MAAAKAGADRSSGRIGGYALPEKVTRHTTIKVRIYPTPEQAAIIDKTIDCCRYIWNAMLADEREFYAATDQHYIPIPARYKRTDPFLKEADSQALSATHTRLRQAFQAFFNDPEKNPYPAFRQKSNAYRTYCNHYGGKHESIRIEGDGIVLPKVKWVRAKLHRRPFHWWKLVYVTLSRSASGKYYCSMTYDYASDVSKAVEPELVATVTVGGTPENVAKATEKLRRMEEKLRRMQPGSHNYEQQRLRIAAQREHIANQKNDLAHKESRRLADAYDAVKLEGTDARLRANLLYKLERQGKVLIEDERE